MRLEHEGYSVHTVDVTGEVAEAITNAPDGNIFAMTRICLEPQATDPAGVTMDVGKLPLDVYMTLTVAGCQMVTAAVNALIQAGIPTDA